MPYFLEKMKLILSPDFSPNYFTNRAFLNYSITNIYFMLVGRGLFVIFFTGVRIYLKHVIESFIRKCILILFFTYNFCKHALNYCSGYLTGHGFITFNFSLQSGKEK